MDVNAEQPGPGDDAALARLVPPQDEIRWRQQLGLSQERFGLLVAAKTDQLLVTELVGFNLHLCV